MAGGDLRGALAKRREALADAVAGAVKSEMDEAERMARRLVRVDEGVLRSVITARQRGPASGTVAPRPEMAKGDTPKNVAIAARVNEHGRKRDPGKPYMTPTALAAKRSFPKAVEAAARKALG